MSRHRRGRITVQHQPTGAAQGMQRMMGAVHAVFGFVFAVIALTQIMPHAGIIGLPFLAAGVFFAINGVRLVVSKNGFAHRVGYDIETGVEEETIVGLMDDVDSTARREDTSGSQEHIQAPSDQSPKTRLEQLQTLKDAGLISGEEYQQKRREILDEL